MKRTALKRLFAGLLLAILLAAYGGQKVHIFGEDPQHFAAHCGDLVPDNGAKEAVAERCIVDDYFFFPFLAEVPVTHVFHSAEPGAVQPAATSCKLAAEPHGISLRAPPAA